MLSNTTKTEKNKLNSNSVWLSMLEINIPSVTETLRIVNNNEDVAWKGFTWLKFPFELDEISQSANAETSQFQIKVGNVKNIIGQYIRQYDAYVKTNGFEAITVVLYIVNSKDLANTIPVYSTNLILTTSNLNHLEVSFTVSARDLFRARTPQTRMLPNSCRFKFKSALCGYTGAVTSCDKSLSRCRQLSNSKRYGGFPAIGNQGVSI
jgi:lambda family phage minor tail protein L